MKNTQLIQYPADLATQLTADMRIHLGNLTIGGRTDKFFEGEVTTWTPKWKPKASYRSRRGTGHLTMKQPLPGPLTAWNVKGVNEWTASFTATYPLDLKVRGQGSAISMALSDYQMQEVDVTANAGRLAFEMRGPHPHLQQVGVAVNGGAAYLAINGGYPNLVCMDLSFNGCVAELDLGGAWTSSQGIRVYVNGGSLLLRVPARVGVQISTTTRLSLVQNFALDKEESNYRNLCYGTCEHEIILEVVARFARVGLVVVA
jgi:hypothetical protein